MSIAGPDEADLDRAGDCPRVERLRPFAGIPTSRTELRHRHLLASIDRVRRVIEGRPLPTAEERLRSLMAGEGDL